MAHLKRPLKYQRKHCGYCELETVHYGEHVPSHCIRHEKLPVEVTTQALEAMLFDKRIVGMVA